jgi:uncharacterized protein YbaA (DUF1428 family)
MFINYTKYTVPMNKTKLQTKVREEGSYVQLFAYKIPKQNSQQMVNLQKQLTSMYRNHGTLHSEFFRLGSRETFEGFVSIAKTVATSSDEELWVELEYYNDRKHRDGVVASVKKDECGGPLFGELKRLISQESRIVMGEFERVDV